MKIIIEHINSDTKRWRFQVELYDEKRPDGHKMVGNASGDWDFINKVVVGWIKENETDGD